MVCDISPAAACPDAPDGTPLRRILFNVPGRITRSARQTILHLSENFRYLHDFTATYLAALARPDP